MSSNKLKSQKQALQHLQAIIEAEQGSATPREGVAGSIVRLVRHLECERSRGSGDVRGTWAVGSILPISFIESRGVSMKSDFDSAAASWKDRMFKFENLAATVFTSSRGTLK